MIASLWEYPPLPYLEHVTMYCPKAAYTYLKLWSCRDKNNKVKVDKDRIKTEFLMSLASFNHNVRLMAREGLVNVDEHPNALILELVDWEDELPD